MNQLTFKDILIILGLVGAGVVLAGVIGKLLSG